MNTMRSYLYHYQAITVDGKVHYLGYSSEFDYGGDATLKSKFGGRYAYYEDCSWDEEEPQMPDDLIQIVDSKDIEEAWRGKNHRAANIMNRMFTFCNIPEKKVVGMIVTCEYDGRWDFESCIETDVVSRPPREN